MSPLLFWLVLLNGVWAICCVLLFQRKGRNPFAGLLLGLVLGILGVLVAACLGDAEQTDGHRSFRLSAGGRKPSAEPSSGEFPDGPAAGWYPDPQDRAQLRYWTGSGWAAQTAKPTG